MSAQVISFFCILKNRAGKQISATYNKDVLTLPQTPAQSVLAGLNKNLQNLTQGEKRTISLSAEEAYGLYDVKNVVLFPLNKLRRNLNLGNSVQLTNNLGIRKQYRVVEIKDDKAKLDGNHPLAGQDLIFEIDTLAVRAATDQEVNEILNPVREQLLH